MSPTTGKVLRAKLLERRGLLKITADRNDRRNRVVTLTAKGRKLIKSAYPVWEQTRDTQEELLAAPDRLRADLLALG